MPSLPTPEEQSAQAGRQAGTRAASSASGGPGGRRLAAGPSRPSVRLPRPHDARRRRRAGLPRPGPLLRTTHRRLRHRSGRDQRPRGRPRVPEQGRLAGAGAVAGRAGAVPGRRRSLGRHAQRRPPPGRAAAARARGGPAEPARPTARCRPSPTTPGPGGRTARRSSRPLRRGSGRGPAGRPCRPTTRPRPSPRRSSRRCTPGAAASCACPTCATRPAGTRRSRRCWGRAGTSCSPGRRSRTSGTGRSSRSPGARCASCWALAGRRSRRWPTSASSRCSTTATTSSPSRARRIRTPARSCSPARPARARRCSSAAMPAPPRARPSSRAAGAPTSSPSRSPARRRWPTVEVTDGAVDGGAPARLPHAVFQAIRAADGPVLVQVPRRGYRTSLACQRCRAPGAVHGVQRAARPGRRRTARRLPLVRTPALALVVPGVWRRRAAGSEHGPRAHGRGVREGVSRPRGRHVRRRRRTRHDRAGPGHRARHARAPSRSRRAATRSSSSWTPG